MLLYIIRHGETNLNATGHLQGRVDEPLNENGIRLAEATGEALKDIPFDLAITSPLIRARRTAELVIAPSEQYHNRKVDIFEDKRFIEISVGAYDSHGCMRDNFDMPGTTFEEFRLFFTDPFHFVTPPGGETFRDVISRTDSALQSVIHTPEYEDKTILISSHGCAIRGMLNRYYENKEDFWQSKPPFNCAVNIIEAKNGESKLIAMDKVFYDETDCIDRYMARMKE